MKKLYRFLSALLIFAVITGLTACSGGKRKRLTVPLKYDSFDSMGDYISDNDVYENERFSVLWDNITKQIAFKDKQSGYVYSSMRESKGNASIKSPLNISYYSPSTFSDVNALGYTESVETDSVYAVKTDKGFKVYYEFLNLQTVVPVEYTLEKDHFEITVDPKEIYDSGDNYITGVSIAPFMCSVKNNADDSYLFYPDGSGALFSNKSISKIGVKGEKRVYGEDMLVSKYDLTSYTEQINIPAFGVKEKENALFAIITDGSEQAYLDWNIGSDNVGYSTVYPYFRIRGYNLVNPPARFANTKAHIQVFDSYISDSPLSVSYYPLCGEKANYSGMAECYKMYLKQKGKLPGKGNEPATLSVKLVGGIEKKGFTFGIPKTVLQPLTTVKQAEKIVNELSKEINGKLTVNLVGFGESGLNTRKIGGGFRISRTLGSKKDMKSLSKVCREKGAELFLDFDIVGYSRSGSGFRELGDSAKLPSGQTAYLHYADNITRNFDSNERYMLLSRGSLQKAAEKAVKAAEKIDIAGLSFDSLSSLVYADYSVNGAELGRGMADTVNGLFKNVPSGKPIMVSAANDYALISSDYAIDTPLYSSDYNISKYDVPFYQMVFRGSIPLSSGSVNTAADPRQLFLKCIEAGVTPTFTLIGEYDNSAVSSRYSVLYAARLDGNMDEIKNECAIFGELLKKIGNSQIINHSISENGLRITKYENGIVTAVNLTDTDLSLGEKTVAAHGYSIWEGEN